MVPFFAGVFGMGIGVIVMHIIANLFVRRDEKRRTSQARKIKIKLNEKCALALKLCKDNRTITESLVCDIEDTVFECIIEGLTFMDEDNFQCDSIDALIYFIETVNINEISSAQALQIGRVDAVLKIFEKL